MSSGYFRAGMGLDDSKQGVQSARGVVTLLTPQASYGKIRLNRELFRKSYDFFSMLH